MAEDRIDSLFDLNKIDAEINRVKSSIGVLVKDLKQVVDTSNQMFNKSTNMNDAQKELAKLNTEIEKQRNIITELNKKQNELLTLNTQQAQAENQLATQTNKLAKETNYLGETHKNLNSELQSNTANIIALKKENEKLNKANKDAKKLLEDGKIGYEQYNKTLQSNTILIDTNKVQVSELQIKQKQLIKEIENAPGSLRKLENEYARLDATYSKLSKLEKNSPFGVKMRQDLDKLDVAISKEREAMGQFHRNVGNYKSGWQSITGSVTKFLGVLGLTVGVSQGVKYAFERMKETSQSFGDVYKQTMAGAKESTDVFFQAVTSGDWSNLIDKMREAYDAAYDYAEAMDLVADKTLAVGLQTAKIETEISKLENVYKDKTKSKKERFEAIAQVTDLEKQKLEIVKKLNNETIKADEEFLIKRYNLNIKYFEMMFGSAENQQLMANAQKLYDKLEKKHTTYEIHRSGTIAKVNKTALAKEWELQDAKIKLAYEGNKIQNNIGDERRTKIVGDLKANEKAEQDYYAGIRTTLRTKGMLEREINSENAEAQKTKEDNFNKEIDYQKRLIELEAERLRLTKEGVGEQYKIDVDEVNQLFEQDKKKYKEGSKELEILKQEHKNKLLALEIKYNKDLKTLQEQEIQNSLDYLNKGFEEEKLLVDEAYANGTEYLGKKIEDEKAYAEAIKQIDKALLVSQIAMNEALGKDTTELRRALNQLLFPDKDNKDFKKKWEEEVEFLKEDIIPQIMDTWNNLAQIQRNKHDEKMQQIEDEMNAELEALEKKGYSEEMLQAKKEGLEEKYRIKKNAEAKKQAERDKQFAIIQAGINTALAITSIWAQPLPVTTPQKIIETIFVGAKLASELALIKSAPIPQYAKGRKGGKDEVAWVGEKGQELIYGKGFAYLTPNKATLTHLPMGASVLPHKETKQLLETGMNERLDKLIDVTAGKGELNITEKGIYRIYKKHNSKINYIKSL